MKKARIILSFIILCAFFFVASWLWKIELLALLLLVWRKEAKAFLTSKWKYGYKAAWGVLAVMFVLSLPRAFAFPTDRVRCQYIDKEGNLTHIPVSHWLLNAIIPEEELCNFGMKFAGFAGPFVGLGPSIMNNYYYEKERGTLDCFTQPYSELAWNMEQPASAAYAQGLNDFFYTDDNAFYVIRPKNYDSNATYPLVVFCHGFLGNWKLYNGIFKDIKDKIVVCIGTKGLSGIFTDKDIASIHSKYIPALEKMGYKIDMSEVSLLGLSNGGSAIDRGYTRYADRFKNLVYISTGVNNSHRIHSKVMIIGGGMDHCAPSMRKGYSLQKRNGVAGDRYWDEDESHFILVNKRSEIIDFLNNNL